MITSATGDEGIAHLTSGSPALIILDTQIGDSEGFTVFRRITRHRTLGAGHHDHRTRRRVDAVLALEAGAADHVTKPPRPRELTARIRAVLRRVGAPSPRIWCRPSPIGMYTFGPVSIEFPGARPPCTGRTSSCPARSSTC